LVTRTLLAAGLIAAAWSGLTAQDRRLLDANGYVRDDAYPRPLVSAADQKYLKIDGLKMKDTVKEVVAISYKSRDDGNKYWGRIAGTKYEAMMHDWVEARFKKYGLQDVHRQPFTLPTHWFPTDCDYTFTAGEKSYTFKSINPALESAATPAGGLELDLVWVGTGTAADFAGRDVKGKAVLIQDLLTPGVLNRWVNNEGVLQRAIAAGAAATGIVYGIADNFALWEGARTGPGFNVGFEDGKVLRDLLGKGDQVKVKLKVAGELKSGLKTASVLGTLPGTTDEDIIIMAHIDGYFEGALDNGSGVAVMI